MQEVQHGRRVQRYIIPYLFFKENTPTTLVKVRQKRWDSIEIVFVYFSMNIIFFVVYICLHEENSEESMEVMDSNLAHVPNKFWFL